MSIFISHSSKDHETVNTIVRNLEDHGIQCWLSSRDIKPGETWAASIMEAIESSSAMLLLLTETANSSQQVSREVEEAVRHSIPVVPVILGNFQVSKNLKYFINSHQWINASSKSPKDWIPAIVDTLKLQLNITDSEITSDESLPSNTEKYTKKLNRFNSKAITVFIVVCITVVLLKFLVFRESDFDRAIRMMEAEDYVSAAQLFNDFAQANPDDSLRISAMYNCARASRLAGLRTTGERYLAVVEEYPDAFVSQLALFWAAKFFDSAGMRSEALAVHSRITQNDSLETALRIYSFYIYGDYMYDASALPMAESLYLESVGLSDKLTLRRFDIPLKALAEIPEFCEYPAKCSYRIATILISEINFAFISAENVAQIAAQKREAESWLGKCITYNDSEYFIAACGKAGDLYVDFANAVFSMDPPVSITDPEAVDEFYNQLHIQFYEPQMQHAIDILRTAVERSLADGVVTDAEHVLINQFATQIDDLSPGATFALNIPDSIYSAPLRALGPYSREMYVLTKFDPAVIPFCDSTSKQTSYPVWVQLPQQARFSTEDSRY